MGRPRKPTKLLVISGSAKKHPDRMAARAGEPKPIKELGPPPRGLDEAERKIWKELVARIPKGVAKDCDTYIVELTVRLTAKMRRNELNASGVSQLRGCLQSLGMTPADRSRVNGDDGGQKSGDFEGF